VNRRDTLNRNATVQAIDGGSLQRACELDFIDLVGTATAQLHDTPIDETVHAMSDMVTPEPEEACVTGGHERMVGGRIRAAWGHRRPAPLQTGGGTASRSTTCSTTSVWNRNTPLTL
jgi:hypothetical protein